MKLKKILFITVTFFVGGFANAQAPQWKSGYFEELCNSYIETASASGHTEEEALDKAATEIIRKRDMATGASAKVVGNQVTTSGNVVVTSRILDKYVEKLSSGGYKVYLLTQTAKHPDNVLEPVEVTDKYPFDGREFVPGMKQIYKGQVVKGSLFIAGEVVCIGGIVLGECMRSSYANLIGSTNNAQHRATYTDKANAWANVRTGFIVGAAAVYVWSFIDAAVSKGARRVKHKNFDCVLVPYSTYDASGLALNINF